MEEGVTLTSNILKFADDTKLFRKIKGNGDKQQLQDDIDKLIKWSENWQMFFNFEKCKCLHAGHGNTGANYLSIIFLCDTFAVRLLRSSFTFSFCKLQLSYLPISQ